MSRNSREGRYAGKLLGCHYRGYVGQPYSVLAWTQANVYYAYNGHPKAKHPRKQLTRRFKEDLKAF